MQGIERRAKWNLFAFTLTHPERYTSLEDYRSTKAEFREHARPLLPAGWDVDEDKGIWCRVRPPEDRTPDAGFKIHLSATHENAREILSTVVPIFVEEGVAFKVLVDAAMLDFNNSSQRSRGSCGKFITVYPADLEQFMRLVGRIHEATRRFEGPYILSDKRYKESKVIFYRYGAFKNQYRVNVYGEPEPFVKGPDGRLSPDERLPYFALPEGVVDPYPDIEEEPSEPVLHGRYKAIKSMGGSSKGGVYRCVDLKTNTEVVVKEARPLINRGRNNPYDTVDFLKNEHRVLQILAQTGVTPKPIELFQDWEHTFLAMEVMKGTHLSSYRAFESFSILLMTDPSAEDIRSYCAETLAIMKSIVAGVRAIHAEGVVIQDLAPQNILFDGEQKKATFVDFEAAYADHEGTASPIIPLRTLGFGAEDGRPGERPTVAGDYKALGSVLGDLLYPVTPFFAIAPQNRRAVLERVAEEKGIPAAFVRLYLEAGEHPDRIEALLVEADRSLAGITTPVPPPPLRDDDGLRRIVRRIRDYILDQIHRGQDPLDLPTDYRRFVTNRLNISYGASGVALFLKRAGGEVPEALLDAIVREASSIDNDRYPPGLYVGTSGVAWTLLELGLQREAEALMDIAARSPILFENADMFYGAAGHGLTNLFFFKQTGDEKYLRAANRAFDQIKPKLQKGPGGYFYVNMGDVCSGVCHGASGIGYFMLRLHQITGREEQLHFAKSLLDFEGSNAEERQGHVVFRRGTREPVNSPYFRLGSAGVGAVALRYHAILAEEQYLTLARKVAHYLRGKFSVFPTNFSGMVGLGGFLVDMHQHTGEASYGDEARRFVDRVMLFALEKPGGLVFPGEELIRVSTDYGTGSSGTGIFLHRILTGTSVPYLDF